MAIHRSTSRAETAMTHKEEDCNRFYDLKKVMVPFHAMAELKQTALAKILMSPILIRKRAHQIVEHAYHQTAHFFMSQNDHHLGDAINFDYVSSPLLTLLKITNGSLCHRSFFLNTSSLH